MTHILLVDDDQQFREMMVQMLTQDGHQVSFATDGVEGLAMARSHRPKLIITDVLMPNMDGIEMIMALRKLDIDAPIIAMSGGRRAISADFNLESALLIGVKVVLAKPFARNDLRQAIQTALQ